MKIELMPQVGNALFTVVKSGDTLIINDVRFDLSQVEDGDTLPHGSIDSIWFAGDITRQTGELNISLLFPIPSNYSQEQAFPNPLWSVADGLVVFPPPKMPAGELYVPPKPDLDAQIVEGTIDWTKLVTRAMKAAALLDQQFAEVKAELASKSAAAVVQIARIQDRIDTLGYGIEIGEATPEEEAEQAALVAPLKAWKVYKYALGKVTTQPGWFESPVWPAEPPVPEIIAAPMLVTADSI